jgi:hypothetical protein
MDNWRTAYKPVPVEIEMLENERKDNLIEFKFQLELRQNPNQESLHITIIS